jgi:protein TonB
MSLPHVPRWRRPEFISHLSSFALTAAMAAGVYFAMPDKLFSAPEPPPPSEIQLSLLEEPKPEQPEQSEQPEQPEQPVAAAPPEPQPPEPETPPPPPKPQAKAELTTPEGALPPPKKVAKPKPKPVVEAPDDDDDDDEEEAPKPNKVVKPKPRARHVEDDRPKHVAGAPRAERHGPVVARAAAPRASAGSAGAFRSCLQAHKHAPTGKDALLQKPHGTVSVQVSISGGSIVGVSIIGSSGSTILDQAARSGVFGSGCGAFAGGASSITGRISY